MIDLHTHILHGVDDGAADLETALEMVRIAVADGTKKIVATPHQRHPAGFHAKPDVARERLAEIRAAAEREGLEIELALAAEIHFSEEIPAGIKSGELLPLSENARYFLLELPATYVPGNIKEVIFTLQTAGCYPVLAHPERNVEVMDRPALARDLRDRGVLLQVTAQSLTGGFGRKPEKAAKKLLKWGTVDVIASDAHHPSFRPPGLREALKVAAKIVGPERAERMVTEIPSRIIEGEGGMT